MRQLSNAEIDFISGGTDPDFSNVTSGSSSTESSSGPNMIALFACIMGTTEMCQYIN